MFTTVCWGNLNRRDVLVNLGIDGKILNKMDGSGLDRSGIRTIDVAQGQYLCVLGTVLMCLRDRIVYSGLVGQPEQERRLSKYRRRWEVWMGVDWIEVA
jgi:hypothetical protein